MDSVKYNKTGFFLKRGQWLQKEVLQFKRAKTQHIHAVRRFTSVVLEDRSEPTVVR